jgi:acyl-CoA synthetase (AMP-forming)/AMP-acid ligase II
VQHTATQAIFDMLERRSDEVVSTFHSYRNAGEQVSQVTGRELYERSVRLAGRLVSDERDPGTVGVLCPQTVDYLVAMLACLAADRVAVPLFAPGSARSVQRLNAVLSDSDAREVITVERFRDAVREATTPDTRVLCADEEHLGARTEPAGADPAGIAYLQYTSGSTRNPAGVCVTQGNLMAGVRQLSSAFGLTTGSRLVSWLPLYHDMGLVFLFTALLSGAPVHVLSPQDFATNPVRWLRAISDHRATHTVTPNSGLDLCALRISDQDRRLLDLRSLRVLVNGSEPVRPSSLRRFTDRFAECGFSPVAHTPGYGLAEATLVVSNADPAEPPRSISVDRSALGAGLVRESDDPARSTELVSCGRPAMQSVRIVDPDSRRSVPHGRTGEIWVKGPNVCQGYWRNPELSRTTFDLGAPGNGHGGGWLRTGDIGFFHDGQLYVVDRLKDVIIVGGQNHYAPDIEASVHEHVPPVRRCAAYSVRMPEVDGAESFVLSVEVGAGQDAAELTRQIRRVVGTYHEVMVADVLVVRPGKLPRTSSGKVKRTACRDQYLETRSERAAVSR